MQKKYGLALETTGASTLAAGKGSSLEWKQSLKEDLLKSANNVKSDKLTPRLGISNLPKKKKEKGMFKLTK